MKTMKNMICALGFVGILFGAACDSTTPMQQMPNLCVADTPATPMCKPFTGALSSCKCSNDEYAPRFNNSKNDTWPACISDANPSKYVQLGSSLPASAARAQAFVDMGTMLWKKGSTPTATDFTVARDKYSVAEGLGSRVARRQDIHYPEVPGDNKFACADQTVATMYPDRCASLAKLKPIVDAAFTAGIAGTKPLVQSARIEAALLWFFYLSPLSEEWTSTFDDIEDVDSAWGYLTGGTDRGSPIGIGQYIQSLDGETYDRAFDGVLAGRCWRDIDKAFPSTCSLFYQRTTSQLDKALTRGMALILRDRIGKIPTLTGEAQEAALNFVNIIGGLMDRAARAIDPAKADQLKTSTQATTAAGVNVTQAQSILDTLFACP
ncbi:MAG TPA: hypothetical protein PKL17_19630 [Pseudomonadota bacterium]|jgi:hypothetical protein|nr:hypothetical protein [Pseudomonadota bacterium]HNF96540.1 hypothetical protein [Pseudomonadota bacterium]HNK47004.1 hypothetical protein [Pseudomonadota bacterium]HNN53325.1 hypothetical protein [Pseudomonadota bacterium]